MAEYDALFRNVPPAWKRQALLYLTGLQSLAWLASLAYQLEAHPHSTESWFVAVNVMTWVGTICIAVKEFADELPVSDIAPGL